MNRMSVKTLLLGDDDVQCKTDSDISKMTLDSTNFLPKDLESYDLIVYYGKRGTKILKSRYFGRGTVKD